MASPTLVLACSTAHSASKSAKKKAAKAIERTNSPAPSTVSVAGSADKTDESFESPYIKELQKNIRNINKKIVNATKTDSLLAEHKDKSLDELVTSKILNADQKAQILKKPALQAQLVTLEEQLAQYQRVHEHYASKAAADKSEFDKAIQKAKADAVAEAKAELDKTFQDNLLLLSQFLRLAAHRREEAKNPDSDESQAIEGVLLAIYSGDSSAVSAMMKLMEGTEERVISVPGELLESTYSNVRTLTKDFPFPVYDESAQLAETKGTPDAAEPHVTAEMEAGADSLTITESSSNGLTNGHDLSISQEWVDVKAPQGQSAEAAALPAATNGRSWADDQPEGAVCSPQTGAEPAQDGFHQVQRSRGRNEREGNGYSRGQGRGEYRGRGNRGDGRNRGRGSYRNMGGAASRPPRRED